MLANLSPNQPAREAALSAAIVTPQLLTPLTVAVAEAAQAQSAKPEANGVILAEILAFFNSPQGQALESALIQMLIGMIPKAAAR
jgi:hypothetical protein